MKPAPFRYVRATSVEHVLSVLNSEDNVRVLAGGQSLIPAMNLRMAQPECLVDINAVSGLGHIRDEGADITIGALARHNAIQGSTLVREHCPLLAEAYGLIANKTVRNRGTLGGNVCHADPASESPAVLLASDATFVIQSTAGERRVGARDFFAGIFETAVGQGELLTEIRIPKRPLGEGWSIMEVSPRRGDFAIALVAGNLLTDGRACRRLRLAAAGIGDRARRIESVESYLQGKTLDQEALNQAALKALEGVDPFGDHHADSNYRRDLVATLTRRVILKALERAGEGG